VSQEDYQTKLQELEKVMAWQTNKIENFGLGVGSGTGRSAKKLPAGSRRMTRRSSSMLMDPNRLMAITSTESIASTDPEDPAASVAPTESVWHSEANPIAELDAPKVIPEDDAELHAGANAEQAPSPMEENETHALPEEGYHSERNDRHERFSVMSAVPAATSSVLGAQVEALAMAILCVAHMCLATPKLGMSHHQKTEQRQDILDNLQDLRHWITHKTMPPGWDPGKLTTMALTVAHQSVVSRKTAHAPTRQESNDDKPTRHDGERPIRQLTKAPKGAESNQSSLKSLHGSARRESDGQDYGGMHSLGWPQNGALGDTHKKEAGTKSAKALMVLSAREKKRTLKSDKSDKVDLPPLACTGPLSAR